MGGFRLALLTLPFALAALGGEKRLPRAKGPRADLKQVIVWGSECRRPEGKGLAFGGVHQRADDGRPHTRLLEDGKWVAIHEELRGKNPLQKHRDELWKLRTGFKDALGRARYVFFEGRTREAERAWLEKEVNPALKRLAGELAAATGALEGRGGLGSYEAGQVKFALARLKLAQPLVAPLEEITDAKTLAAMRGAQVKLEIAAEALGAEPPPRVCGPVVYDAKTELYVVFGGDHFDYLTNDVWVFDPAKRKWRQRHPEGAPQPRAAHKIAAADGKVRVSSGIIYRSNIGYMAPCYWQLGGAEWVYDIAANAWKAPAGERPFPADSRAYRAGPYAPEFYMEGERPDAAANEARLKAIPVNTWVNMKPPKKYEKNRDWGTSVIDPDHDLFLQWSGGHCAHPGTDVAQYHLATNRWEVTFPNAFPLGLTYSNSSYPSGFSFNLRPWMTGHTYKGYAYSSALKCLVLLVRTHQWEYAHDPYFYLYDPLSGDWTGRHRKHPALCYVQNMYTTVVCSTSHGTMAWARDKLLKLDGKSMSWEELKVKGKLPSVSLDASDMAYDSKRDRVLLFRKRSWNKPDYNGQVYALDVKTMAVTPLSPGNGGEAFGAYTREVVYHAGADLFVLGRMGKKSGQLAVYDPAGNRWVKVKVAGTAPFGYSTGHVYDAKRQLLWVVDSRANIWCLRLDTKKAGLWSGGAQ